MLFTNSMRYGVASEGRVSRHQQASNTSFKGFL